MHLSDLAREISARCPLSETQLDAWIEDVKATGVKDGPALQDAFDRWRVAWKYQKAPRPAEFREFYKPPSTAATDEPSESRRPPKQEWADYLLKGQWGHEASIYKPTYCRELVIWAKANSGQIPGADVMQELGDNESRFQTRNYGRVGGIARDAILKAGAAMNEMERRCLAYHRRHCALCNPAEDEMARPTEAEIAEARAAG